MTIRVCHSIIVHSKLLSGIQISLCPPLFRCVLACLIIGFLVSPVQANSDPLIFDDQPLGEALSLPPWFKLSFLDIQNDIAEAAQNNRGLIIYFGRHDCPYCKALLENNWGRPDIKSYTQKHFDVIAIDVLGHRLITDPNGQQLKERDYSAQLQANFTPTLHFFDKQGKWAFKLTGYRPPYQFKAALEYVADNHHRKESFADYYARAEMANNFGNRQLNSHPNIRFSNKLLDLSKSDKPVLILFDRPRCHACDVLHGGPLQNKFIIQRLQKFNSIQLDISSDQVIITPTGQRTTSRAWTKQLQLDYTPTLIFFNPQGKEIIRISSVVWFYRLRNVLDYVSTKGYLHYPSFQQWRNRNQ